MDEFYCPHCDGPIDEHATACPHCGSDHETGWNPDAEYAAVDLGPYAEPSDADDGPPWESHEAGEGTRAGSQLIDVRRGPLGGTFLLTVSLTTFLILAFHAYAWGMLIPTAALLLAFALIRPRSR